MENTVVRRRTMQAVHSKDTKPERAVRQLVTKLGYRYRLHRADLPGKPDLAFMRRRKVVFVHGCFWHGHNCARGIRQPKSNSEYWISKIARNRNRDAAHLKKLTADGWGYMVIWECELKRPASVLKRLTWFISHRISAAVHG